MSNPLEKLFKDIDDINEQLTFRMNDFLVGCFGKDARERIMQQIDDLKIQREVLEKRRSRFQSFFSDYYSTTPLQRSVPVFETATVSRKTRKGDNIYKYFMDNLDHRHFQFSPPETRCVYCGRLNTSRTGIVFTLDPSNGDLVDICTYCYLDKKQKIK